MRHLGDITKISGYDAPIVDCVIGGSPCQDLSIAGKRAGLAGERSGLFMEQIRIVKEMRERGRAVDDVRPRYMVWENVPGAFSSNRGQDFAAVLEETIRIAEPEAPGVPVPEKGWSTAGVVVGDGWSVAWRVLDAQFWGVPQRRRRIALVADFGGQSAPEILFVRKGVSGHTEPSGTEGQGFTPGAEKGVDGASECLTAWDCQSKRIFSPDGISPTLQGGIGGGVNNPAIFCLQGNGIDRADTAGCNGKGWKEDVSYTLNTIDRHAVAYSFDSLASNSMRSSNPNSGCREVDVAKTLDTSYPDPSKNQGGIAILDISHRGDVVRECGELVPSLCARAGTGGNNVPVVYRCTDVGFFNSETEKSPTLLARTYKDPHLVSASAKRARRLTPLECERLQGYPSYKKWDVSKMTKDEYIAWNIAEKNIIVDAKDGKVFATRGPGGVQYKEPKELAGSLVNGYKVVSIRNGATKLSCRVHRIVWISQYGVIPEGYCVDHINNDKTDNRLENLQLLTPAENSAKAKEDGLYHEGLDNKATKIDPELYDEICYFYNFSETTYRELAEIYGISKSRIGQIIHEDGWTNIGTWVDSKGRKRETSDAARYKALGNSIALPPWKWVLKRLCAQYERDATMASLFDGIGGFPLIWEQLNGKGSCLWASEVEPFCVAVTERRFDGE